jgi:putative ABC transport system permease protein
VSVAQAEGARARRGSLRAALGGGVALVFRRLRLDPGSALALAALVAATCFVFAAAPRLFNAYADDGLRHTVSAAPISASAPRVLESTRVPAGPASDPFAAVDARAGRVQHAVLPPLLDTLVEGRSAVVSSPAYVQSPNAGLVRSISLTIPGQGVEQHLEFVAGRFPRATGRTVSTVIDRVARRPRTGTVPLLEVALSNETAEQLEVHVGQRLVAQPDWQQALVRRVPVREQRPVVIEVVGIFHVEDPTAPYWFGDTTLDRPNLAFTPNLDTKTVFARALLAAGQYPLLLRATRPLPLAYEYRYPLDDARIDAGLLPDLEAATAQIGTRYANAGPLDRRVSLGLGPVLDRFRAASSQARTLLAVAALGLLVCALANLGLLGAYAYERHRAEIAVARVRGASPAQILGAQAAEGAAIAIPAGLLGWGVAVLTVDARSSPLSAWLTAAVVAGTVALLVASVAGIARRRLGAPEPPAPALAPRGRLALEALVAGAALAGVFLVRRRGLEGSGFGASGRFDPYLAAVPVLLGIACGIAVLRLYPLPLAAAARAARRTRGLALQFGLTRAARQTEAAAIPVVVIVVAVGLAAFAATMASTIRNGQDATGWRAVGADIRVDAPDGKTLPPSLVRRLAADGTVARAYVQDADLAAGSDAILLALDAPAYEALIAGTPADVRVRGALETPSPIPSLVSALVSNDWPTGGNFQIALPNQTINFLRVAGRASLPGVPHGTPFAVVSLEALRAAGGQAPVNRLYVAHVDPATVRRAVEELAPGASISARAAVARSLRASPLVAGAMRGFDRAVLVATAFAAIALALLVLIAARARARDLALVRTMGASAGELLALSIVELTPLVALALVLGSVLGIALPYLLEPGLDLAFFTGSRATSIAVPVHAVLVVAVVLLALLGVMLVIVSLQARRAELGRVLRIGER